MLTIDEYYCPDIIDFEVQGNTFSEKLKYFELSVNRWDPSVNVCATDPDIEEFLRHSAFDIVIANTYFDFDDYKAPIKTFIDDRFVFDAMPDTLLQNSIFIQYAT